MVKEPFLGKVINKGIGRVFFISFFFGGLIIRGWRWGEFYFHYLCYSGKIWSRV